MTSPLLLATPAAPILPELQAHLKHAARWLEQRTQRPPAMLTDAYGRVVRVSGMLISARMPSVSVGELCRILNHAQVCAGAADTSRASGLLAEVVGFSGGETLLAPLGPVDGISSASLVEPLRHSHTIEVGDHLLGRVLDAFGRPLDNAQLIPTGPVLRCPVITEAVGPAERPRIDTPLVTGVRAIDGLLTLGQGQRVGLFAGPGCGKTTLLAALARGVEADAVVFGLIGERGRELRELLEHELDPGIVARSVFVCATSDRPAMERARAAFTATTIAEGWARSGRSVLLLIDSLTRFARAQREIGLAAGEPPGRLGFPPSVYALLPRLIERAGKTEHGSISAVYTVLVEGETTSDPIADEARSLLDGHILLSRKLAERGHYPAIDVMTSLSRVMSNIVASPQKRAASRFRELLGKYQELELLISLGEYQPGNDALSDAAVRLYPELLDFLRQDTSTGTPWMDTQENLYELCGQS